MSIGNQKNILGKPTNTQIKARIAVLEAHFEKSGNKLGTDAGLGNTTVDDWNDKQIGNPTRACQDFLKYYHISQDWWKTGEGPVFITQGDNLPQIKENGQAKGKETFFADLIENNENYSLIPRAVLKDYKIVPDKIIDVIIASNESEKKALRDAMTAEKDGLIKDYEALIKALEGQVQELEKENAALKKRLPPGEDD